MPYNPSPKVRTAEDVGKHFDKCMVIIFLVDTNGTLEGVSWGDNRARCAEAKSIMDDAWKGIYADYDREY